MTKRKPRNEWCEHCGAELPLTGKTTRFCSKSCGDKSWKQRNHQRASANSAKWQRENRDRSKAIKQRYADAHRDELNANARARGKAGGYSANYQRQQEIYGREVVLAQIRDRGLAVRYGISAAVYAAMLEAQDGRCAICHRQPTKGGRRLAVDHDHKCCPGRNSCGQCVRALLCTPCNQRLGTVEDIAWLARATAYLAQHSQSTLFADAASPRTDPPTSCVKCHGPIVQPPVGRRRKRCHVCAPAERRTHVA